MKPTVCIIREKDRRSFEMSLECALGQGWKLEGPLQIIVVNHWFCEPTLIYVQMLINNR